MARARALREMLFLVGVIEDVRLLTPRMRRVRICGPALKGLSWTPGQQVRVHVTDMFAARTWLRGAVGDVLRTYSIWAADADAGTLDLIVFDHVGDSPGNAWARSAVPGQEVTFSRPQGDFVVRPGGYHLFAGDETASVAFGPMLGAIPETTPVHGVVEAGAAEDHLPLSRDLVRVERTGDAVPSEALIKAVQALDLPEEPGVAYLAGEARTLQAVRRHLVTERGWPRRSVVTKPFWTPGKRGMD
ncbi:siderophore-interacting protein [Planotetraspora kaengkrachanensis]|uniref:FAD-binding FR-type domain-containing protein n=1 Tax=Planotetraspora kaengkrachanensis TaxID=575193 RepID=A0A8J3VBZ1_9ACTN|nr:siderophore-interacting protein [Planotetraspora kaengkrachanensis]GIG84461.1 hypothetical protein Pka01_75880 [Planotetraspora kaengkrachanensis]